MAPRLLLLSLLLYCLLGYVGGDAIDEVPSSSIRIRASSPISTVSEGVESETYCRYSRTAVRCIAMVSRQSVLGVHPRKGADLTQSLLARFLPTFFSIIS